jgi:hypothetical protein
VVLQQSIPWLQLERFLRGLQRFSLKRATLSMAMC